MSKFLLAAISFASFAGSAAAQDGPSWSSNYLEADRAGQLSVCSASIAYRNAFLMVRLYDEAMDFLYSRDDFTLPFDTALGLVQFVVDGQVYKLAAFSFAERETDQLPTTNIMQLALDKSEYGSLFAALRYGTSFQIAFPNGDSYSISLRGSSNALAAASNCWARNPTGPLVNNPFSGSNDSSSEKGNGNNPFETF